eukprot:3958968-Prorocentrum_lima.AAC.1
MARAFATHCSPPSTITGPACPSNAASTPSKPWRRDCKQSMRSLRRRTRWSTSRWTSSSSRHPRRP